MEMVFRFAESAHLGGDPQKVGEKLHQIRKHGRLTPATVIDEARPKDSILHRYFDWNDRKAAQKWRIVQARDLIQAVVTVKVNDEETLPVRSFVSVDNFYEPVYHVMSDSEMRQKALQDVQLAIQSLQDKLRAFTGLRDVLEALERVSVVTRKHVKAGPGMARSGRQARHGQPGTGTASKARQERRVTA